jgi:DNA-binding winged helix-turn-helix (wHTH) protein
LALRVAFPWGARLFPARRLRGIPMSSRAAGQCYRFDRFVLDTTERRLTDGNREIHLRPKTFDTLAYLLEHRGRLVRKAAILDALWPATEVVENALPQCVRELRDALGDDQRHPRFVETIPRAGYRFIADVQTEVIADQEDDGVPAAATAAPTGRLRRHRLAWAAGICAIVVSERETRDRLWTRLADCPRPCAARLEICPTSRVAAGPSSA